MKNEDRVHLFRGAPAVRSWSKYRTTDRNWTLCGIRRTKQVREKIGVGCIEDALLVSCPYCRQLMAPSGSAETAGRVSESTRGNASREGNFEAGAVVRTGTATVAVDAEVLP